MEATEVRKLAALEDRHWWYAERRWLGACTPEHGPSLDIGAAGGGNTRVLRALGLRPVALEYGADGARVARARGLDVVRGDARALPFADASMGLVVAFDVLEHLDDDAAAITEIARVLRPGGRALVAVPADMALWSAHDEAVGHVRRYDRGGLLEAVRAGGLLVEDVRSWNVLLRPVVRLRRRASIGSDLSELRPLVNAGLRAVVIAERWLPVGALPGVSLLVAARRPPTQG